MGEGCRLIMAPDVIQTLHCVATVWGHKAIKEVILPFEGKVEAVPGKGTGHRLDVGIRLVYGHALAALDAVRYHIKGSDDLIRHEAAKIADDFLARIVQLPGALAPFRIELLELRDSCHDSEGVKKLVSMCFKPNKGGPLSIL